MKGVQIANLILTSLVFVGLTIVTILLFMGHLEVRQLAGTLIPEPRPPAEASGAKARLLVLRGLHPNWEYSIYEGLNILGRADEQPVDIDLEPQETKDRIWSSRQHAAITCEAGAFVIEDLKSANGTYVNRNRVPPGEKRSLKDGDIIQIGEVQIKVLRLD